MLDAGHALLTEDLAEMDDADLERPVPTNWGEEWPAWRIFWTMIHHDAHHGGEIGALRDLYRATRGAGPREPADRLARMERAVILEGARTPIGRFLGSFAETTTVELGTIAAKEALARAGVAPDQVDQTIVGHARQAGNGPNTGRQVSIHAGVPEEVSAYNVNIACGSGMKAVQLGAQQIALGDAEVVLAGGMENMTRVPFLLDRMRTGYRMGNATVYDAMYRDGLLDPLSGLLMGETAENLVDRYDISRDEQDEFALESQRKAASGADARAAEIVPVEVPGKDASTVTEDEHPRPDTTLRRARGALPRVPRGRIRDGRELGRPDRRSRRRWSSWPSRGRDAEGREPLARIAGMSWAGVPPEIMGIGPVPATKKVLEKTGLSLADIDLIEINEAFAAQVIACERELKFDRDRLNLLGGGISLGHPIGMSGARILLSLAYQMRDARRGAGARDALHLRRAGARRHPRKDRAAMTVHAVVLIQCQIDEIGEAAQAIAEIAGVSEVYSVAGEFDLIAIVRVANHDDLAKVIPGGISKVEGVERTETLIAFQVYSKHDLERMFSIGFEES